MKSNDPIIKSTNQWFLESGIQNINIREEVDGAFNSWFDIEKEDYYYAYSEITGYGATSDGYDMVQPSGEGAERCMKQAKRTVKGKIDYINSHGTSTPIGDIKELEAIKNVFRDKIPIISSTKSLTGHSLGATGVHEAIYCILMMKNNFICGSSNIFNLDEKAKDCNILLNTIENKNINNIMSNSFGFGGTNATLIFSKYYD